MKRQGPEATTQAAILDGLAMLGIFAWRQNTLPTPIVRTVGGRREVKGFRPSPVRGVPDILGVLPHTGRLLAIEVKAKYGKPSDEQRAFLAKLNANGALAIVARSWDDVAEALKASADEIPWR